MKEFVPNTLGLKVRAFNGKFQDFAGIAYMGDEPIWQIDFTNGKTIRCSGGHKFFGMDGLVYARTAKKNDRIMLRSGRFTRVKEAKLTGEIRPVYDLVEVAHGHAYETNSVMSKNCDFVSDDETLINPLTLSYMSGTKEAFFIDEARWYSEPEPNAIYLVGLDPAMGTQNDAAALQIYKISPSSGMIEQVAEWQSKVANARAQMVALMRQLHFLYGELEAHPDQDGDPQIYWTLENNSLGEANLVALEDIGEHNIPGQIVNEPRRRGSSKRFRLGLNTNKYSKAAAHSQLKNLVEGGKVLLLSENLVMELKNYVRSGETYKAKPGMNDDLVASTLLCLRIFGAIRQQGVEVNADLTNAISDDEINCDPMPIIL